MTAILTGDKEESHIDFICISVKAYEVERFSHAYWPFVPPVFEELSLIFSWFVSFPVI